MIKKEKDIIKSDSCIHKLRGRCAAQQVAEAELRIFKVGKPIGLPPSDAQSA
jgi:hypothetical protein